MLLKQYNRVVVARRTTWSAARFGRLPSGSFSMYVKLSWHFTRTVLSSFSAFQHRSLPVLTRVFGFKRQEKTTVADERRKHAQCYGFALVLRVARTRTLLPPSSLFSFYALYLHHTLRIFCAMRLLTVIHFFILTTTFTKRTSAFSLSLLAFLSRFDAVKVLRHSSFLLLFSRGFGFIYCPLLRFNTHTAFRH